MTKIEHINLHNFNNREHCQFMNDFSELTSNYPVSIMGMEVLFGVFQNTLMAEDLALRVEEGSEVAKKLEQIDQLRDRIWHAIILRVQATRLSPLEEEAQSALIVERIMRRYGDVYSLTYNEESEAVSNLTNELLLAENEINLDRIGLATWVLALKSCNDEFLTVYNNQKSEFAGRESGDVKAARTLIDPLYKQLTEKINASIVLEFARPEVISFVNKLNEKIKEYQTSPALQLGSSWMEEKDRV